MLALVDDEVEEHPCRLGCGARLAEPLTHPRRVELAVPARPRGELVEHVLGTSPAGRTDALVRERLADDLPPVVLGAEAARDRHSEVGEEELVEGVVTDDRADLADLEPGQVHRDEQHGDAAGARFLASGAHEEVAEVGHRRV